MRLAESSVKRSGKRNCLCDILLYPSLSLSFFFFHYILCRSVCISTGLKWICFGVFVFCFLFSFDSVLCVSVFFFFVFVSLFRLFSLFVLLCCSFFCVPFLFLFSCSVFVFGTVCFSVSVVSLFCCVLLPVFYCYPYLQRCAPTLFSCL